MKLLVSHSTDIHNIFHIFAREIHAIWELARAIESEAGTDAEIGIVLTHYEDIPSNRWRRDLLKSTFRNVWVHHYSPAGSGFGVGGGAGPVVKVERRHILRYSQSPAWMVDPWTFRAYEPVPALIETAAKVRQVFARRSEPASTSATDRARVVFVERKQSRVAYDAKTRLPLSGVLEVSLSQYEVRFETVCFDEDVSLEAQAGCLSNARIMISVHGAANTNLFLLPGGASLFEINFRKHWYCDPVCSGHRSGQIPYVARCDGPLTYRPHFHKADYHNLAQVFGVRYKEFEILDADRFLDDNPVNLERIYVDAEYLVSSVVDELGLSRTQTAEH